MNPTPTPDRDRRAAALAVAEPTELADLAEQLLARLGPPTVTRTPETGLVMMQVREPVRRERFHVGEVVVSRAEVEWGGEIGWSARVGSDREAALSAALCDAAAEIDPVAAEQVAELCDRTSTRRRAVAAREWRELAATRVRFEELD